MDSNKRYRIELNERQLRVIYNALEEWFRIPLGQWRDVAQRLAFRGDADWAKDNAAFNTMAQAEDHAEIALKAAGEIAQGRTLTRNDDEIIASDMWRILRVKMRRAPLYGDGYQPYQEGTEPPIKVEAID